MNDEDDLLFSVRPSPPHSPKRNAPDSDVIEEEKKEEKSFLFQLHLQEGERKEFKMDVETSQSIAQIKTRLADMQEIKD